MARIWNPLWRTLWDEESPADYASAIRRLILASVDWIEEHPDADLQWQERDLTSMIPEGFTPEQVGIVAYWSDMLRPSNEITDDWFKAIVSACMADRGEDGGPSFMMMKIGIACGMVVHKEGWDNFNFLMMGANEAGRVLN